MTTATSTPRTTRTLRTIRGTAAHGTSATPDRTRAVGTPAPVQEGRGHVRLTGRGRLLVLLVLVGLLLAAFAAGRSASSSATSEPAPAAVSLGQLVVQPGDTLWSVARSIAPDRDPRDVVAQLRRLNDLPSGALRVGQQLLLPVSA